MLLRLALLRSAALGGRGRTASARGVAVLAGQKASSPFAAIATTATRPFSSSSSSWSDLPENMREVRDSQKSVASHDRSREAAGQAQAVFTSAFMSDQQQVSSGGGDEHTGLYDAEGPAHLESVLQTNVPEPYRPGDDDWDCLKEGVPEGLSDTARDRGTQWAMMDRLEQANEGNNH